MKKTKYWAAGLALAASSCAFANIAEDNVVRSAAPANDRVMGNECTDRSIKPFARPKDSALSDDMLRAALILVSGFASGSARGVETGACGERSTR